MSNQPPLSEARLAIQRVNEEILAIDGDRNLTQIKLQVPGVTHKDVRSELNRLSMGDLLLGPNQPLKPTKLPKGYDHDFPGATTDLEPAGVTIRTYGVGRSAHEWEGEVALALWYHLGNRTIGEVVAVKDNVKPYIPKGKPMFAASIGIPGDRPTDGHTNYERLVRAPKNDEQILKFLQFISSLNKKVRR